MYMVGGDAMSYAEFPNTVYHEDNLSELIGYYKQLKERYQGTLDEITSLSDRLDKWEASGNALLTEKINNMTTLLQDLINSTSNEIQDRYNSSLQTIRNNYDKSVNDMAGVSSRIEEELSDKIDREIQKVELKYSNLDNKIDEAIYNLNDMYNTALMGLREAVNSTVEQNYAKLISELDVKVQAAVNKLNSEILPALSIIKSLMTTELQLIYNRLAEIEKWTVDYDVEKSAANVYFTFGFSALEWYNEPQISCIAWNKSGITCIEWLTNSKVIFNYYEKTYINPITGCISSTAQILFDLIISLRVNAITAGEYDDMKLTAQDYDKLHLTAEQYDWRGFYNVFRNDC